MQILIPRILGCYIHLYKVFQAQSSQHHQSWFHGFCALAYMDVENLNPCQYRHPKNYRYYVIADIIKIKSETKLISINPHLSKCQSNFSDIYQKFIGERMVATCTTCMTKT